MQRNPDSAPFLPRHSSGLNPNRAQGSPLGTVQRGTVSMPTSPLLGTRSSRMLMGDGQVNGLWRTPPHPAQNNLSLSPTKDQLVVAPPAHVSPFEISLASTPNQWFSQHSSPILPLFPQQQSQMTPGFNVDMNMAANADPAFHDPHQNESILHNTNTQSVIENDRHALVQNQDDNVGSGGRKKRSQVRVACTHCQKACKKCSNTRPCERCVKYGMNDCIDSTRKPRKTGIKRGPYKRRASKYPASQNHSNVPAPKGDYTTLAGSNNPAPQYRLAPSSELVPNHQQSYSMLTDVQTPTTYSPGPTAASNVLSQALSAAINGPRWINGQRVQAPNISTAAGMASMGDNQKPSPLYPRTPVGRFPMALGAKGDPFSRAVSPIRQFSSGLRAELKPDSTGLNNKEHFANTVQHNEGFGNAPQQDSNLSPFEPSAHPSLSINTNSTFSGVHSQSHSPAPPGTCSPLYIPSTIRKPSLWTLMSANSSRPSSPNTIGIGGSSINCIDDKGQDSPVLFDQPIGMDNFDVSGNEFEGWNGFGSPNNNDQPRKENPIYDQTKGFSGFGVEVSNHGETDGKDSARVLEGMGIAIGLEGLMGLN
ncbi:uncharacterized protein L203_102591 [Cryptococcus depauperatus CBS 7841]|uniref:Zn(2)-C6 fungal-type domain-containing protein n=1 Tax=Cryptococcus depauperatus CBS 7841 TaxID=1295531 RepID=A0A1E3IDS3_9TREE|nr:hypothetical protein L203_03957 [Cryptococcus depauperatus CBS 7841]